MLSNKRKIIYIAIAIVTVVVIAVSTVFILKSLNNTNATNQNQTTTPITKKSLDDQMLQVIQLLHSDPTKARLLLNDLDKKYKDLGDTNGAVNVEAQLYLLDHPETIK